MRPIHKFILHVVHNWTNELNEAYSEGAIKKFIEKFREEADDLNINITDEQLKKYIERFDVLKNSPKTTEKDLRKYSLSKLIKLVSSSEGADIGEREERKFEGENYTIKVFVKDYEGYVNLNRILFLSFDQGYYFRGRIKTEWLLEHHKGLFVTTTGLRSKINHFLSLGHENLAEEYLLKLYDVFRENLIADIQFNKEYDQKIYNDFIIRMADKYNLRLIVTNNVMYARNEDAQLKDILVAIGEKKSVQEIPYDKNRHYFYAKSEDIFKFNSDFGFDYPDWLIDRAIKETAKVADE